MPILHYIGNQEQKPKKYGDFYFNIQFLKKLLQISHVFLGMINFQV